MEATDWEELSFLLESAGIPVDKAMGFGEGKFEEVPDPTPEEFEENLKVEFKGKEFKFLMPDLTKFQVWGTQDIKQELYTPPPFMDIEKLCEPQVITPELLQEAESLQEYLDSMKLADNSKKQSSELEELQGKEDKSLNFEHSSPRSERSATPELVFLSEEKQGSSSSSSSTGVSKPTGAFEVKPIHSTGSSGRATSSGIIKGKESTKHLIPKGKHSSTKLPHETSKGKHLSKTPPRKSQERHASRPSFRITSKEKPIGKPLASVSIEKLKPASPSSRAKHSSVSSAKSQGGITSIIDVVSRVEPRKLMKRPRTNAARDDDSKDITIEISDSSDESV